METTKKIYSGSLSKGSKLWSQICNEVLENVPPLSKFSTVNLHGQSFIVLKAVKDTIETTFVTIEGVVCMVNRLRKVLQLFPQTDAEKIIRDICNVQDFSEFDDTFERDLFVIDFSELNKSFITTLLERYKTESELQSTSSKNKKADSQIYSKNDAFSGSSHSTKNYDGQKASDPDKPNNGSAKNYTDSGNQRSSREQDDGYLDNNLCDQSIFTKKKHLPDDLLSRKDPCANDYKNNSQTESTDCKGLENIEDRHMYETNTGFFYKDMEALNNKKDSKVTIDFNSENGKRFYEEESENSMFSKVDVSESQKNDFLYLIPQSDRFYHSLEDPVGTKHDNIQFNFPKQWPGTPMDACFLNDQIYSQKIEFESSNKDTIPLFDEQSDDNSFMKRRSPQKKHFIGPANGARPFVCHFRNCNRAFKRFEHLKRHYRIHTGERPFKCKFPGCQKSFARSDNLNQHLKVHNSGLNFITDQRSNGYRHSGKD